MKLLSIALEQSRSSRLMRVAIVLWVVWCVLAGLFAAGLGGSIILNGYDEDALVGIVVMVGSIPVIGLILWFIAGSLRWIISPKE